MVKRLGLIAALVALILAGVIPAAAQDQAPVASLLITLGTATLTPVGGEAQDLVLDDETVVAVGDQIAVSEDGEAILTFFEGAESVLGPGTTVEVTQFETTDAETPIGLTVVAGQTINSVEKIADAQSRFQVATPTATISVRGTQFGVYVRGDQLTQVVTLEGLVAAEAQGQTAEIPVGFGVKIEAGQAPGKVNPWGFGTLAISAPAGDVADVPVLLVNQDNGQEYYYRASDLLAVALGSYDVIVQTPGPFQTEVTLADDTLPAKPQAIPAELSTLTLTVVDDTGAVVPEAGNLILTLQQGDLLGTATVAPGDPVVVGPGLWTIGAALDTHPDRAQQIEVLIGPGETLDFTLTQSAFVSTAP
jgi:hypothetical protein